MEDNINNVNSVCTTPIELIQSEDFKKGLSIVLDKNSKYNKEYYTGIFDKIGNVDLSDDEKIDLTDFLENDKVKFIGQKIIDRVNTGDINVDFNGDINKLNNFTDLINLILNEQGFKNITNIITDTANLSKEIIETEDNYIDWGNPTEENKKWINDLEENNQELFLKLKGKIKFEGEITIIDGMKFDNKPLGFEGTFEESSKEAKKVKGRRLPTNKEFEKLFDLFKINDDYKGVILRELLSIAASSYWSSTDFAAYTNYAWNGNFGAGYMYGFYKTFSVQVLCIHD